MGQRGRKCWQTDFIRTDGEVCPEGSLNSATIQYYLGLVGEERLALVLN